MNIGIDLDGVILNSEEWFRAYAEIYDMEHSNNGKIKPDEFLFQKIYGWDNETTLDFFNQYGFDIERNAPFKAGAQFVLNKLKEDGHKLFLITARGKIGKPSEEAALHTIKEYQLPFDKVILKALDKATICINENIDYMIDDSPLNVLPISEKGIRCLYLKSSEKHNIISPNVIEVESWGEIYRFFKNLK